MGWQGRGPGADAHPRVVPRLFPSLILVASAGSGCLMSLSLPSGSWRQRLPEGVERHLTVDAQLQPSAQYLIRYWVPAQR